MELFKKRLKEIGMNILYFSVLLICAGLIAWGIMSLPTAVDNILTFIIGGTFLLTGLGMLFYKIWQFIKWLFIEPFRRKR